MPNSIFTWHTVSRDYKSIRGIGLRPCAGMPGGNVARRHVGGLIALHRRAYPQAKHARLCNWLRFWPKERVRWIKQRHATFGVRAAGDAVHSAKRVRPCSAAAKLLCDAFHANRDKVLRLLKQYSPIEHVTKDDPPIFMTYANRKCRRCSAKSRRIRRIPPSWD